MLLATNKMGMDGRKIFQDCGIDPDSLGQSLNRIPVTKMQHVWHIIEGDVEDKNLLAATIVSYLNASSFHALGFGLYSSSSIKELFLRLCRFSEIISSSVNMYTSETKTEFHFIITDLRPVQSHLTSAVTLLFLLRVCQELGGHESAPTCIEAPWEKTDYTDAIRSFSNAPINFKNSDHKLIYDLKKVKKIIPNSSSQLSIHMDNQCQDYLNSLDEHRHLPWRVRSKIIQGLSSNRSDIETIAMTLHMSTRTLQRKLDDEQTSFSEILLATRKQLLNELIENSELSATQIAYALGFSSLAPFSSMFKVWSGQTFTEHRRSQQRTMA